MKKAVVLLLACLILQACGERTRPAPSAPAEVIYRIGGAKYADRVEASLTYRNATGGTEQKNVTVPWETSFTALPGQFLYLSAQNTGSRGAVTCDILVNGQSIQSARAEGGYKIATCSGSVPR